MALIPFSLLSMTVDERVAFSQLSFKRIPFDLIPEGSCFYLTEGLIQDDSGNLYGADGTLLGILPFIKQVKLTFTEVRPAKALCIDPDNLAYFLLKNPGLLTAYLNTQEHMGATLIGQFLSKSKVISVSSDEDFWHSPHFSLGMALYRARELKSKSLILELANEGTSVFSMITQDVKPAIIQSIEGQEEPSLTSLVNERLINISDDLDILNVQFQSVWEIDSEQWSALLIELSKYSTIIVHTGMKEYPFVEASTQLQYHITSNPATLAPRDCPRVNIDPYAESKLKYPIMVKKEEAPVNPLTLQPHDPFFSYFKKNFGAHLNAETLHVLGNSNGNAAGLSALLRRLVSNSLSDFFEKSILISQGSSYLLSNLFASSPSFAEFKTLIDRFESQDLKKVYKAVFPKHGLHSEKAYMKYIYKLVGSELVQNSKVIMAGISGEASQLIASGKIAEAQIRFGFSPGFFDSNHNDYAHGESQWLQLLAKLFRLGHLNIVFHAFEQPRADNYLERMHLVDHKAGYDIRLSNGRYSQLREVGLGKNEDLWKREQEIYESLP